MKSLFNVDNPFMQALARVGDLMMLSVITLMLCLPVVTFGPAVTALFKTVYALTLDTCGGTAVTYFRAFRQNFKQSCIAGIAMLIILAALCCDVILLRLYYEGRGYQVLLGFVGILALLILCITAYLFPLISRYNNTLSEHLRNAAILMITHFPKTVFSVLIHLSPLIMFYFRAEFMLQTLVAWIFLAPGLIAQADSYILKPVFEQLEKNKADAEKARAESEYENDPAHDSEDEIL